MSEPLIVVRELHKSFLHMGNELEVLRGIDLDIHQGEIVAIVGKSGAGKSTLLQIIGTLDAPSSGILRLGSDYLVGLSRAALAEMRNRTIGFVFQFHHLLPEFNALENVMMPGLIHGGPRQPVKKRAQELLRDVGLAHRETHRPGELSGGEQQRVALARALLLSPKLILADEPTGNLDSATSDAIHKLFFEISEKHGTTIVVVTHNAKLAAMMPRTITMRDGKIERDSAEPEEAFEVDQKVLERSRALAKIEYVGFAPRLAARLLDTLWLMMLSGLAALALGAYARYQLGAPIGLKPLGAALAAMGWPLWVAQFGIANLASVVYHLVAEGTGGATVGKALMGQRVRSEDLSHCGLAAATWRSLLYYIDGMFFGLVAYIGIKESLLKQRFGDGLAQTTVVRAATLPAGDAQKPWMGIVVASALACLVTALGFGVFFWLR